MENPENTETPRTLPEAAAPQGGARLDVRAVGAGARVQIPVVPTAANVQSDASAAGETQASTDAAVEPEEGIDPASVYAQVGGEPFFDRLVGAFYRGIAEDTLLRPMYPEEDLGPAEERMRLFLIQYFGGPTTYSQRRGHPRLRMRHFPFPVTMAAREAWLTRMRAALDEAAPSPLIEGIMWDYFERAATAMINTPG